MTNLKQQRERLGKSLKAEKYRQKQQKARQHIQRANKTLGNI
jgi:hypothetical protein